jgi:branched-chain amino acid transport system permease protein
VGVAGALLMNFYYVFPSVGGLFGILAFVTVALGGFGNITGAFYAGILIGVVETAGGVFISPVFKYTIVFAMYLVIISIRPKGLFGWKDMETSALALLKKPWVLITLLVLFFLPFTTNNIHFHHVLIMFLLFATLSQAWNVIGGFAGQVSFGHATFFGIGAYAALVLLKRFDLSPWVGMLIGGGCAAIVAILIGYPVFRLKGHYFAISTFAVAEIAERLFANWDFVEGAIGLPAPVLPEGLVNFMWYKTKMPYFYIAFALFVAVLLLAYKINRSRLGFYLRAIKQSHEAAEGLGIDTSKYKVIAMMISAFLTAICGSFYAQYILFIDPPSVLSLDISIKIVLITVLGGAGTVIGPILGAAILIPLSEYSRVLLGGTGKGMDLIVFGALILFISVYQPQGLVGFLRQTGKS